MKKRILLSLVVLVVSLLTVYTVITRPENADLTLFKDLNKKYSVTIYRDTWGVPHLFGKTDRDAVFGLAYSHSEDDFATIQGVLAAARGRLAVFLGQKGAPNDFMVGLLNNWKHVREKYTKDLSPETRKICQAYADGINYYASKHPDQAWKSLYPVRGEDIAAGFVHKVPLFFGFEKTLGKLFRAKTRKELTLLLSSASKTISLPGYRIVGSNTFAVSPKRTSDGSTFLAVNSHQPWKGPVAWYEAHLHSKEGLDVTGGLFPGSPVILHGHNRNLGWAHTVNHADLYDVYILESDPKNPLRYRVDGKWLTLTERKIPIKVHLLGPFFITVTKKAYDSIYGPVVKLDHGTYAVRFSAMGNIRQVEQWYRMNRAKNFKQWRSAMKMMAVPCFNCGYADRKGNILYLYNSKIPLRDPRYNWKLPVAGNTRKTLWKDYISFEKLPRVMNPVSGFIQNCNSSPFKTTTGPGNPGESQYSPAMGIEKTMTNRALRALELFGSDPSITWKEFHTYKYDMKYSDRSLMKSYLNQVKAFKKIPASLQEAHASLIKWDMGTEPGNKYTALAILTFTEFYEKKIETLDRKQYTEALGKTCSLLKKHFFSLTVPWEKINRIVRGKKSLGMGGGPDILHAVYGKPYKKGTLKGHTGDSYVLLVKWDRKGKVFSESIHQYGSATRDASSPHYADQMPLFVQRKLKKVLLDLDDIKKNLSRSYAP